METKKRLIDANAFHQSLVFCKFDTVMDHLFVVDMINSQPTVDAVEVVRCKDCRFYERDVEYYPDGTKDVCRLLKRQMLEDGFCSVGERKDGRNETTG